MNRAALITGATRPLPSIADLSQFAAECRQIWKEGAAVALNGELGAGKTAFVRAFIENLCRESGQASPRITSPTYVLHQTYPQVSPRVEHFDWYRIDSVSDADLVEMGYWAAEELARTEKGFVFVEWAERSQPPVDFAASLRFDVDAEGRHSVKIEKL